MAKLNLDFYRGEDLYSDGDIEDEILRIVKEHSDFTQILRETKDWAVLYHLTPIRENLLNWYHFNKDSALLEIGAGCGALTGMLSQKVSSLTAIELSKRRAQIIYNRHKDVTNLEIFVGNLSDIKLKDKFEYVTLIGVLEYAGIFTKSPTPFHTFLDNIKQFIKKDGKLLLAIENRYGIKYFSGASEDHTGGLFNSIEGYDPRIGIKTFGKKELQELLKEVGFVDVKFYYPMPDYKLPTVIYSDEFLPKGTEHFSDFSPNFDQNRYSLFSEKKALEGIIENDKFDFFANSFLVEATL